MKKTALVTAALAGLVLAGCATSTNSSDPSVAKGECHGVNACKGKGDCGGAGYSCAGKNSCKGQGWLQLTKADCDAKGGTFKSQN